MNHIRFKRVRVSGRVITNPLADVPHHAIVVVTRSPQSHAPQDAASRPPADCQLQTADR